MFTAEHMVASLFMKWMAVIPDAILTGPATWIKEQIKIKRSLVASYTFGRIFNISLGKREYG